MRATWTSLMLVTIGIGFHSPWSMSPSGPGLRRTSSGRWAYRVHLARAHSRMETPCAGPSRFAPIVPHLSDFPQSDVISWRAAQTGNVA